MVRREVVQRAGWPGGQVSPRAVDGRMKLLRRRAAGHGIAIHTVRGIGFLLEDADAEGPSG